LDRRDVAAAAGLVQLVLHQADPTTATRSARVTVLGRPDVVEIRILVAGAARRTAVDDCDDDGLVGLAAALGARLRRLTSDDGEAEREAKGDDSHRDDDRWIFEIDLPREGGPVAAATASDRPRMRRLRDHLRRRAE
nr:hypothetical protein [Micromonospora sp. DSM 115978]